MIVATCEELIAVLEDYVDGSLAPFARLRFRLHLAVCRSCRAYLKSYRETIRMARLAIPAIETVPEELVRAVLAAR